MHHAMIARTTLSKSCYHFSNLPRLVSVPSHARVPHRGRASDVDLSDYGSKGGQDLLFHHQHFARPMKPLQKMKLIPRKKFEPEVFYSLEERFKELDPALQDPELHKPINIGFSASESASQRRRKERMAMLELKKNMTSKTFLKNKDWSIDVSAVQKDWLTHTGPSHICTLAHHSGIFRDLFGPHAYFLPLVPMALEYDYDGDTFSPVCRGNVIKPREAQLPPRVGYPSPSDALWTMALTNPDGCLYRQGAECIHWLVTNIPGSDIGRGEEVVPYLPPVPPRGVGHQRMVFVLYRQQGPLADPHQHAIKDPHDLRARTFSTEAFYRTHEDSMTPAGLAWYNTDWDASLTAYYHDVLGMKEPHYEYEFPAPFVKEEQAFPDDRNFVTYIDMYRDPKEVSQEMLLKRLRRRHPLRKEARVPFPGTNPIDHTLPSWVRQEIKLERLGWGKYKELYRTDYDTEQDTEECLHEAARVETEKRHQLRIGADWKKLHIGKKKAKALREAKEASAQEE